MKRQTLRPVGSQVTEYIAHLYKEYAGKIFYAAFKYTSDKHTAEEAVQRVFEKALMYPQSILNVPEEEILYFLSAMLRNVMYTMADEEKKNSHLSLDYEDGNESYHLEDPENAYLRFINLESVKEKLAKLKPPLCDTMLFHYVYGFKYREIADMFHISERAVAKRIALAKKELRKMFRKEDFYER